MGKRLSSALMAGSPTLITHARVAADGFYYACSNFTQLWKWDGAGNAVELAPGKGS